MILDLLGNEEPLCFNEYLNYLQDTIFKHEPLARTLAQEKTHSIDLVAIKQHVQPVKVYLVV